MSQEMKNLKEEELEQVTGGSYSRSDYEDVIGENEDEYFCRVCGRKYDKEYCYYIDVVRHLLSQHGIDRRVETVSPVDLLKKQNLI